jgi:hypothetical protein
MKNVVIFMIIWNVLWPFDIMCGGLVEFVVIWYIFHILVCLDQEKSGNHDRDPGITSEPDPKIVFFLSSLHLLQL